MSATMYGSTVGAASAGQAIFTDDVSLQVFMEHLKRLVSCLSCLSLCFALLITVHVGCWRTNELKVLQNRVYGHG